ncbi:hypothetical protein DITRI_Ditri01bG0152600 [Diplodiscus trichospermus]
MYSGYFSSSHLNLPWHLPSLFLVFLPSFPFLCRSLCAPPGMVLLLAREFASFFNLGLFFTALKKYRVTSFLLKKPAISLYLYPESDCSLY